MNDIADEQLNDVTEKWTENKELNAKCEAAEKKNPTIFSAFNDKIIERCMRSNSVVTGYVHNKYADNMFEQMKKFFFRNLLWCFFPVILCADSVFFCNRFAQECLFVLLLKC